jgi:hypothetical protein
MNNNTYVLHTRAGNSPRVTVAAVINGQTVNFGAARCSTNDQFNKKIGRHIAIGRANKNPIGHMMLPQENFSQWFTTNAAELAKKVADDARVLNELRNI